MNRDFNILVKKIDAFRRKFFLYQFLRGLLIFTVAFILIFLVINLIEYKLFMASEWRRILFVSSSLFLSLIFIRYVVFSLLQLTGLVRSLGYRKASGLIHKLIPDIKDRLTNVIELHDHPDAAYSDSITQAAISQKINELKIFDFSKAVNLRNLKTLVFYFSVSFLIVIVIHLFNKSLFIESGNRIIHFNQNFTKPAPYSFDWENAVNGIEKGKNFTIRLKVRGSDVPDIFYINIGGNNYLMNPAGGNSFEFEMVSVINPVGFYFTDLKYNSPNYRLDVFAVPVINGFTVHIIPPSYTGLDAVDLNNIGDLQVPKGSEVRWKFNVFDTDSLILIINNQDSLMTQSESGNIFIATSRFLEPIVYEIKVKNKRTVYETAMNFRIDIIEDSFPEIKLAQVTDSSRLTKFFFRGNIHDDYGFSDLKFHVNIELEDSAVAIPFNRYVMPQDFYFSVDLQDFNLSNKAISYYFSVTDNDAVNGPKTTTSESFNFVFPDRTELNAQQKEEFQKIENLISESQQIANELKNDLRELQMKNLNSNITDWEKSRLAESLVEKKNDLERVLEQIEKSYKQMNNFQNTFSEQSEDIIKKQEQIQELLEDVMTDELKKLLDEFSKLAQEFNEQRLNQLSKQMDLSFDDLSKQLDKNLQMLKKMKVEQQLENIISDVNQKQRDLEEMAGEDISRKDSRELLNELILDHKDIEDIQERLNDILEENAALTKPLNFDNFEQEFNDIKESIRNALQEMQQNNRRNSSGKMREASEKLKNLAYNMQQMLNTNSMQQNMENVQNIKQILKNLLVLSFEQENVLKGISSTGLRDPSMVLLNRQQRELISRSEIIKDSLYALSARAPQITGVVNNELLALSINLDRSSELMNDGLNAQATTHQQLVITAANNLALMLSDVLQQIEDMMNNPQSGEGDAQDGQGGQQMGKLQQQSESIREQLQKMIDQLKNGQQPMSKQMSESLMMHEMMQQMLRELMNSGGMGENARKQLQDIDRLLEQNRRDIMNKNINPGMIRRQQEIMTRLLEADRSEKERDKDNKRESNTADEQFYSNPARFFNMDEEKNISIEYLQRENLKLNNFYQGKFRNYMERFNNENP